MKRCLKTKSNLAFAKLGELKQATVKMLARRGGDPGSFLGSIKFQFSPYSLDNNNDLVCTKITISFALFHCATEE